MCGIVGVFAPGSEAPVSRDLLRDMTDTLAHRGPDDEGFFTAPGVGLGFRRLSIVDLTTGHQPLANEDGTIQLILNGEIYNHAALRETLTARGHRFRTRSDAEAVVHAYEEWGVACLDHLQGMFALLLHDAPRQRLFAARDRLGIKPLHYAEPAPGHWVLGSEIKALLAHPDVPREMDREAAALYVTTRYLPSPLTLFRGIRKLPPGHYLLLDREGLRVERWWDVDLATRWAGSFDQAKDALVETLRESVRARLMADVPLGAFLSGGLDSTIIVSLMAELHPGPVKTYSVGFAGADTEANELPYARAAAERFGTEHHEIVLQGHELAAGLLPLIWNMDEPLPEPAAIPLHALSRLARETVVVALTGEGADELFAGYPKYGHDHLARLYARMPGPLRAGVRSGLDTLPRPLRRVRVAERSLGIADPAERWASWFAGFAGPGRRRILHPELLRSLADPAGRGPHETWRERALGRDPLTQMLYVDVKTWLADDLLMKMDRMSMAASLEARVPFLDHRMVNLAFSLPSEWKHAHGRGKHILREAFAAVLPDVVRTRPKAGFPVPLDRWFRVELAELVRETLAEGTVERRGLLDPREVRRVVEEHAAGRRDHSREIWTLLNLELWQRVFLDPPRAPRAAPAEPGVVRPRAARS